MSKLDEESFELVPSDAKVEHEALSPHSEEVSSSEVDRAFEVFQSAWDAVFLHRLGYSYRGVVASLLSDPGVAECVDTTGEWRLRTRAESAFLHASCGAPDRLLTMPSARSLRNYLWTDAELEPVAAALEEKYSMWTRQPIWMENRVREMVVHDQRHSVRVDLLASQLATPFLMRRFLTPAEMFCLSTSAVLHDWGHTGGALSARWTGMTELTVSDPFHVRALHGLLTQELLSPEWDGMHGLDKSTASAVGILCGHHQRSTSFDARSGPIASRAVLEVEGLGTLHPPTLLKDVCDHNEANPAHQLDYHRIRFLVALLRLADAADVGQHRVPDYGEAKEAFLRRCVQAKALETASGVKALLGPGEPLRDPALEAVHETALRAKLGTAHEDWDQLVAALDEPLARDTVAALEPINRLRKYVQFVGRQGGYYERHRRVLGVTFDLHPGRECLVDVDVRVAVDPYYCGHAEEALLAVFGDVSAELVIVAEVLREYGGGMRFRRAIGSLGGEETMQLDFDSAV